MIKVIVQKWEESERGWGRRPDGYSIHLTEEHRRAFIHSYWAGMPNEVPDEYSRPFGTPYEAEVEVTPDIVANLHEKAGAWMRSDDYPGTGGVDGWMNTGGGGFGLILPR